MTKAHKNFTVTGFLLGICIFASGLIAGDGKDLSNHQVSVRVQDFAELSSETLEGAKREAEEALGTVGIPVNWVDCTLPEGLSLPTCQQPIGIRDIALRIAPNCRKASSYFGRCPLSHTIRVTEDVGTGIVTLFNDQVEATASRGQGLSNEQVLGHLMAREIGRLLLPPGTGSDHGIRRTMLTQRYWEDAAFGGVHFTEGEVETMLAGLQMMHARQQALRQDEPNPDH